MPETKGLFDILQAQLHWHRARLTFATTFALALIKVRTVTFSRLAPVLNPHAIADANYRRINAFSPTSTSVPSALDS